MQVVPKEYIQVTMSRMFSKICTTMNHVWMPAHSECFLAPVLEYKQPESSPSLACTQARQCFAFGPKVPLELTMSEYMRPYECIRCFQKQSLRLA
jgi:hypothetical protein